MFDYSVVIPVFNSELTLETLFADLKKAFAGLQGKTVEYIFVDDGSFDKSWEILQKLNKTANEDITIVKLNRNYGQSNATFCGLELAKGKLVITIDDDLQQPPEEINKLINTLDTGGWDIVYGVYEKKQHSFFRNLSSKIVRRTIARFIDRPSATTSFRIIKGEIVKKILPHKSNFIFIDELIWWYTDSVSYVVTEHKRRTIKKSGYSPGKLWSLLTNLIIFYTNFPLKLMIYGGLFFSVVFFIAIIGLIVAKIMNNTPLGYSSTMISIMFGTSIILLSLGVIGEYISRLYSFQNKKPPYIIKDIKK
ncbi:MAG: glycosyltransferase family 2 protein [Chlorobi bacterium]|nr:glycosyltransferase family 2 protein [Chlorobiota bacterium]